MSNINTIIDGITSLIKTIKTKDGYSNNPIVLSWHDARAYQMSPTPGKTPVIFVKPISLTVVDNHYPYSVLNLVIEIQCLVPLYAVLPAYSPSENPSHNITDLAIDVIRATGILQLRMIPSLLGDYVVATSIGAIQYADPEDGSKALVFSMPISIQFTNNFED